jgi:hypothetical protein
MVILEKTGSWYCFFVFVDVIRRMMKTHVSHMNFQTGLAADLKTAFRTSKVTVAHNLVQMKGLLRREVEVTFHTVRMSVRIGFMVLHLADGIEAKPATLEGTKYLLQLFGHCEEP